MTAFRVSTRRQGAKGFTLIELSIVLVIIGLIVGGVLVGQDLIRAAEVRATISQIEKYNTAANTFRDKFNALPGDMNSATAATFGFPNSNLRGGAGGQGDGNGIIDGCTGYGTVSQGCGETAFFWEDLSSPIAGNLIDGNFSTASISVVPGSTLSGMTLNLYFPPAKLGRGNFFYVFEQGGTNYYGVANISSVSTAGVQTATASMSVQQAYNMDKKMDDGLPTTGNVQAQILTANAVSPAPNAASASAATCFDTTSLQYSLTQNGGAGANCALSFRFQ